MFVRVITSLKGNKTTNVKQIGTYDGFKNVSSTGNLPVKPDTPVPLVMESPIPVRLVEK